MGTPGRVMIRADGKRGLLANGKAAVFNADGDCPECCGEPCEFCSGATPKRITVVISGSSYCQCSEIYGGRSRKILTYPSLPPDDTYHCVRWASCVWGRFDVCSGSYVYYDTTDCSGGMSGNVGDIAYRWIQFEAVSGGFNLSVWYETAGIAPIWWLIGYNKAYTGTPNCPGTLGPFLSRYEVCAYDYDLDRPGNNFYGNSATLESG